MRNGRIRALNLNLKIGFFNINAQYDNHHPQYTQLHNTLHMILEGDTQLPRLPVHCVEILFMACTLQMEVAGCWCQPYLCMRNSNMGSTKEELEYTALGRPIWSPRKSNLDLVPHASSNPTWPNLNQLVREKTTKQEHNCSVCYELQWVCDVEKIIGTHTAMICFTLSG